MSMGIKIPSGFPLAANNLYAPANKYFHYQMHLISLYEGIFDCFGSLMIRI
jgi:hypothetical protein